MFVVSTNVWVSFVFVRRLTSPIVLHRVSRLRTLLPKSRGFGRSMRMLSGRSRLRKAKTAGWRRRWPPWRLRRWTSGAGWRRRGGRLTRPSLKHRLRKWRLKWHGRRTVSPANTPRSGRRGSTPCAVAWTRPRRQCARKSSGRTRSSWKRTTIWVRGPQTSKYPTKRQAFAFLEWLQEELVVLPTFVQGFMSFASLVTGEGTMNALSREGCKHYEVFDQSDENFEREIFKVEDPCGKAVSGGTLR
jgi:hypothetical protein